MPADEFTLIYRYFSALGRGEGVDLSVGDDCAILRLREGERLATSVDTMVAAVHFPEDSFPEDIGFRAVSVAASDLAAMGARPLAMTVALTLPAADELWLHAFSQGLAQAVGQYQLPLVAARPGQRRVSAGAFQSPDCAPATGSRPARQCDCCDRYFRWTARRCRPHSGGQRCEDPHRD